MSENRYIVLPVYLRSHEGVVVAFAVTRSKLDIILIIIL